MEPSGQTVKRVAVILVVAAAIACSWLPAIERLSNEQVDAGLQRALVSFAVAKSLNAAISLAQGTAVSVQPLGVGVTLTLGEVLDPLNDLVEQFASLMLLASVAFGIQKVLLTIGAHWLVSLAVTGFALVWAALHFYGKAPVWLSRILVVLVVVRFAIPVATIGSDLVFREFLEHRYQQAESSLQGISTKIEEPVIKQSTEAKDASVLERLKAWGEEKVAGAKDFDFRERLKKLQAAAEAASTHIIDLMVVFIMQTIIVPLVLLWALLRIAGGVLQSRGPLGSASRLVD